MPTQNLGAPQQSPRTRTHHTNVAIYAASNSKPKTPSPSQTPFQRSLLQTLIQTPRVLRISALEP